MSYSRSYISNLIGSLNSSVRNMVYFLTNFNTFVAQLKTILTAMNNSMAMLSEDNALIKGRKIVLGYTEIYEDTDKTVVIRSLVDGKAFKIMGAGVGTSVDELIVVTPDTTDGATVDLYGTQTVNFRDGLAGEINAGAEKADTLTFTAWRTDAGHESREELIEMTSDDNNPILHFCSGTGVKWGFGAATPDVTKVLATGGGASVDDVITALQEKGIVKQA